MVYDCERIPSFSPRITLVAKIDFKKEWRHLYRPSAKDVSEVEVPALNYLMIDGHGDPNTAPEYQLAIEALYSLAYKAKFIAKKRSGLDYVVPPLEGLWWAADMAAFSTQDKSAWQWTMMIMQPDGVNAEVIAQATAEVEQKKNLPTISQIRLESLDEGHALQIMHIGPYAEEAETIARMHAFAADNGYALVGKHHEIYLSDPRKVAPQKLRTVLRQPVEAE
ncbi:MAG: GyrI-like domain-containing protein [Anaerolineales bacterium]|jgi:hypothetical protein|nr:GyrI-like domain-containing protein [Anaerolineales bacterium]MDP7544585.1 GyrI-like domain-containing protein [Anaerolineales bacterium]MDP7644924.1 GyrI-like domain-containing protein [Anaerolineales bacterium]